MYVVFPVQASSIDLLLTHSRAPSSFSLRYGLGKERTLQAFEDFSGVHYRARLLRTAAATGDPYAKFGDLNDSGGLERWLWVAENWKVAFQKVSQAWWEEVRVGVLVVTSLLLTPLVADPGPAQLPR